MAATYRRRGDSKVWHFCTNCSQWPKTKYIESATKPTYGEQCNQCRSKQTRGICC